VDVLLICVGFVMCGCFVNMCTCIYCVFFIISFMYIYCYFFCLYRCKCCCHRVTTQLQLVVVTLSLLLPFLSSSLYIIFFISSFTYFSPSPPPFILSTFHFLPNSRHCNLQYAVRFTFHFATLHSGLPEVKEPISSNTRHDASRSSH
jgi:energy-coupling factor transporter transmembrane protein EcfT